MPAGILPLVKKSYPNKTRSMAILHTAPSAGEDRLTSPAWHHAALCEAERLVEQGRARFSGWAAVKQRLRRKVAQG
jgi:hypothetical protein